ncbi:hypothetical protein C8Q74DRAFT_1199724 [Fomes fomentarius]|nr:hypothetical protein C8Q74DRAFT_1199724 [Fomes fomentarius]
MSLPRASLRLPSRRSPHVHARPLSTQPPPRTQAPSAHARFYTDYAAGMIPVALLGSAVYIVRSLHLLPCARAGLRTWQQHLAHEKFLEEARVRVEVLEAEVTTVRKQLREAGVSVSQNASSEPKKQAGWWPW